MTLSLVNTPTWTGVYGQPGVLGPNAFKYSNTPGNLLVMFAAWDVMYSQTLAQPVPVGSVADSSRNFWRLGSDSGNAFANCRVGIWYCPNALAVSRWFSFALTGYASSFQYMFCEFTGLPANYYPSLDFGPFASKTAHTSTTLALAQTSSQADYVFAIGGTGSTGSAITAPAGWNNLGTTLTGGTNPNGIGANAAYLAVGANTAVAPSWGFSVATEVAGTMVAISQGNAAPPVQLNTGLPNFRTQMAFGSTPGDPTTAITENQWTDISARTIGPSGQQILDIERGQEYELAQPEAGSMTVMLNNQDGALKPDNPGSPFYSNAYNVNPSFQYTISPWAAINGGKIALSNTQVFASGTGAVSYESCQLNGDGTTAAPGIQSELVPITDMNQRYLASGQVYSPSVWASGFKVGISWFTSGGGLISTTLGTATALPATTWTQYQFDAGLPPATTAFARVVFEAVGTPTAGQNFYMAEVGFSSTQYGFLTGLVRQGVPTRVMAYWLGRMYCVGYGYVERYPQEWPEWPQWGWSKMVATDAIGVAAATTMPSAVQGEILADGAYVCLPFNEQYTVSSNTLNGLVRTASECDGLIAINASRNNQKTGIYKDGTNQIIQTGQSLGFLGDSGTGMGASSYSVPDTTGVRGPGAIYGPDPGLPAITNQNLTGSFTAEFWVEVPTPAQQTFAYSPILFQLLGYPFMASGVSGQSSPGFIAGFQWTVAANSLVPGWLMTVAGNGNVGNTQFPFNQINHIVFGFLGLSGFLYINNVLVANLGPLLQNFQITNLVFGETQTAYGLNPNTATNWNYAMAYGSIYPYFMSAQRIAAHYNSGTTGFSGDAVPARFGRYLAWAGLGLLPAGSDATTYVDAMQLGPAYSTANSPLASAINADCESTGARWFTNACGNLVLLHRGVTYNQPSSITFGDNVVAGEVPYLPGQGFDYDNSYVQNVQSAQLTQGPNTLVAPVVKDPTSINQYFPRGPNIQTVNGNSLQDAYDRATWSLYKYRQPALRAKSLTVDLAGRPSAVTAMLQTDLSDVATLNRRPLGGTPYQALTTIQKIRWVVGPGNLQVAIQASPYTPDGSVLTADGSANSILGQNTLAW